MTWKSEETGLEQKGLKINQSVGLREEKKSSGTEIIFVDIMKYHLYKTDSYYS